MKLFDEIKYMARIATAGSKEARELAKVKNNFEKVFREYSQGNGKTENGKAESGVQRSIEYLPDGKKYVRADRQVIFGNDPDSWSEQVESYINSKIRNGENISLVAEDGDILVLTSETAGKIASNKTNHGTTMDDEQFYVKSTAGVHIDELAQVSVNADPNRKPKADKGSRHGDFAEGGWTYRNAFFQDFDGKYYRLTISAAKGADGNVVYNIGNIEERSFPKIVGSSAKGGALNGKASSEKKVPQKSDSVNSQHSFSQNSKGDPLSEGQRVLFKDAKTTDELGRLKPFYHGMARADRVGTVFDPNRATSGPMAFFTDNRQIAECVLAKSEE